MSAFKFPDVWLAFYTRFGRGVPAYECDGCGEPIEDSVYIAGYYVGKPNVKLHRQCAIDLQKAEAVTDADR